MWRKVKCSVPDCLNKVSAISKQGLCEKHRMRLKRYGDVNTVNRPKDWGRKGKHPLYLTWHWIKRMHLRYQVCEEWYNDFWTFVEDMGLRPSPKHQLYRTNKDLGYNKSNCIWKETLPNEYRAEYMKNWREDNFLKCKNYELKSMYGINTLEYAEIWHKQNGRCAICKKLESDVGTLAVDHDHNTGKVRGLLCVNCNKTIGHAKDSVSNLTSAVKYLEVNNG